VCIPILNWTKISCCTIGSQTNRSNLQKSWYKSQNLIVIHCAVWRDTSQSSSTENRTLTTTTTTTTPGDLDKSVTTTPATTTTGDLDRHNLETEFYIDHIAPTEWAKFTPTLLPSLWGVRTPMLYNVPWAFKSVNPKQDVDPFSHFNEAKLRCVTDRQQQRSTNHCMYPWLRSNFL